METNRGFISFTNQHARHADKSHLIVHLEDIHALLFAGASTIPRACVPPHDTYPFAIPSSNARSGRP